MACATDFQGQQNLETYSLVWLDAAVYSSKENMQAQKKLRSSINYLTTFDRENECEKYIHSVSQDDRVVLIVSGQLGERFVPQIHRLQQIIAIYIYCMNTKQHEKWAREIKKVKAVRKDLDELIKKILADQTQRQHNKTNETISISIYSTDAAQAGESTSGINGYFIHSQLLIDCLIRLEPNVIDKNRLILLLKEYYEKNAEQLQIVEEFQDQYESSSALWWYSRDCFLYRVLNKALRDQDIDLLFLFRFVIRDIERQLEEHKCTSAVCVYRGQLMSKHEIETLRNNIGQFISNNSFLSTSLNQQTSWNFLLTADNPNNLERVFWMLDADSTLKNINPFSNITSFSAFADEKEVLFMIGSIFKLVSVDQKENGTWMIKLQLCLGSDHQLESLLQFLKKESVHSTTTLLSFGDVLLEMGQHNKAEKYYQRYLDELSPDENDIDRCYYSLGIVAMKKDDLPTSLKWLHKSLEIRLCTLKSDDLRIANNYNSIGRVYRKMSDLDQAIEMFEKALTIQRKMLGGYSLPVAQSYSDIGAAYERKQMLSVALEYHQKVLKINKKQLPEHHIYIGIAHTSIASTYRSLGNHELSLKHANEALEIFQNSLPNHHQRIGWVFEIIGLVHEQQGKLKESLTYLNKALHTYEQTLSSTHYYTIDVKRNIDRVSSQMNSIGI